MKTNKYPRELSRGANNIVLAITEGEVAKLFIKGSRGDIGSEADKMKFANSVNDLVPKFLRLEIIEDHQAIIMERLIPLERRALPFDRRKQMFSVFCEKLYQLHNAGLVHCDIERPTGFPGGKFDNVLITWESLRLIDLGISQIKSQVGDTLFQDSVKAELSALKLFEEFLLEANEP